MNGSCIGPNGYRFLVRDLAVEKWRIVRILKAETGSGVSVKFDDRPTRFVTNFFLPKQIAHCRSSHEACATGMLGWACRIHRSL
jgi:hypothetical protein